MASGKIKSNMEITWAEYLRMINMMHGAIWERRQKFGFLVAPGRGSLIPATILSHKLKIPKVIFTSNHQGIPVGTLREMKKSLCLIVDDISDTGRTLRNCTYHLPYSVTATLFKKPHTKFSPTIYIHEVPNHCQVVFPYEIYRSES